MSTLPTRRYLDRSTAPHLSTLILMAGMAGMAMNMFLPSLPSMTGYFNTDYAVMQLSVSLYLACNAVLQIIVGPLSDRFGRRPVMLTGLVLFLLATAGTLTAKSAEMFLIYRMGQSTIVAGIVISRAAVRDMVPTAQAASMIGYVSMGMAIVPMIAPVIGGMLDQAFGWQANFWFMLGCGTALLVLVFLDQGETAVKSEGGLMAQVAQYPALLRSPRFWGYCLSSAFASGAFFAYLGGAPFVATSVFGLSPQTMGLFFGAPAIGYALGNFISGRFSQKIGINPLVLAGTLVSTFAVGLQILIFSATLAHHSVFFGIFTLVGLGNGLVIPNATAGMLSVRPKLAGSAAGLGGAMMIGGGAALSAFAGVILTEGSGPMPLLLLMFATSLLSVFAILSVVRREAQLARSGQTATD
ncbi:multidrug effflux MFS transporter [Alphaproteobacteria bacterium KMM 3653]|uniref:Bcr/CflA family efflux transporter n=1 Tax=Harenicola maris TaxID=2841044 RepID=A0AAP2CKC0_9RHOB|nr:multidrug effflux MFS transporter [Harenicola maris]